jgi:hypothetical protein
MLNYSNGVIYKICCKDAAITESYVGSTCDFRRRKTEHKYSCNNEKSSNHNYPVYRFIRDNGGFSNWEMIEIKKVNCNDKRELEMKEREYLEMLGGVLNKCVPSRGSVEYYNINKEKSNKNTKAYYLAHKEQLNEYHKEYYETNKEQLKENGKIYREANKEQINENHKAYRLANKKEIKEKASVKFNCGCGGRFTKSHKSRHLKSPKHQKYLELN